MAAISGEDGTRTTRRLRQAGAIRPLRPAFAPPTTKPVLGLDSPVVRSADVIEQRPNTPSLTLTHERVVDQEDLDQLVELYVDAIGPLDEVAALQHLDSDDDIRALFLHEDIIKIIAWDGTEAVGLGLITNNFDAVVEASTTFFHTKYPEQAAAGTLFYGMTVLVKASNRGMTAFARIYLDMWQIPAKVGGVLIFDICKFNVDSFGAHTIIDGIAANFPGASWDEVDRQTWFAAELPNPLPGS